MRKAGTSIAPAILLVCSMGFSGPAYAEGDNPQPLSENCQRASETSGSVITSMSKILCRQEYENAREFTSLKSLANSLIGRDVSDTGNEGPPKQHRSIEKPPSTPAKQTARAKVAEAHKWGAGDFASSEKAHSQSVRRRKDSALKRGRRHTSAASIRESYFIGRKLRDLTPRERRELRSKLESLMTRQDVKRTLDWIRKHEGGGLVTVVGPTHRKSKDCRERIGRLNTSGHPKEQGLPNKCFLTTKHGLSTAAGLYQIVYYRNWRSLRPLLGLDNFSARNQGIAALELMRSSKVKGGEIGEGFVALVQGDIVGAICKGTDPWASSPYSRWYGGNSVAKTRYARHELRKLKDEELAKRSERQSVGRAHNLNS